jgi:hypothetical protein
MPLSRSILCAALVLAPAIARAEDGDDAKKPPRQIDFGATFANGWMKTSSTIRPYQEDAVIQLAAAYRGVPWLAVGGVASFSPGIENDTQLWRVAGEARFFAVTTRIVEVWGGGELGAAWTKYSPSPCGDCGGATDAQLRPRFAPELGAAGGVDLKPLPYVALGLEGRALFPLFLADPATSSGLHGVSPIFTLGFTLSGHVPLAP